MDSPGPIQNDYAQVGIVLVMALAIALMAAAIFIRAPRQTIDLPPAWAQRRFGFVVYALIFLAFDMEMIFMYPWAVVFADIGISAFLDMLVFIVLLSAGIAYAWGLRGLEWE